MSALCRCRAVLAIGNPLDPSEGKLAFYLVWCRSARCNCSAVLCGWRFGGLTLVLARLTEIRNAQLHYFTTLDIPDLSILT